MKIDFKSGYIDMKDSIRCIGVRGDRIKINELIEVELKNFLYKNINMTFLYINDGNDWFMYSDWELYNKLLKLIIETKEDVENILCKFDNDYGEEHALWEALVDAAKGKFISNCTVVGYNYHGYIYDGHIYDGSNCYRYNKCVGSNKLKRVNDIKEAYDILVSVLPQNIKATKKQEVQIILKPITDICGENLDNLEAYVSKLESANSNILDKWTVSMSDLISLNSELQQFVDEKIVDSVYVNKINLFFEYCLDYVHNRVRELIEKELLNQFGSINDLKKSLRDNINHLGFMELLDLFKEYKNQEKYLSSKARHYNLDINDIFYKKYIDVYRLGSILISDKMNQINRNKAKNKYVPQDLLDEALMFYYETESVQNAYSIRSDEEYAQEKKSGDEGEEIVEYALKWLEQSFECIKRKSKDRLGNACIYLSNPKFIDEKQEYDHLIVSNKGIFNIETKNYAGKLLIDQHGNWIRKKSDVEEGIRNPLQQIRRHEKMLLSFLPSECKIISIICIANDAAIIEGIENSPIPIVKSDMLVEFMENYDLSGIEMTSSQKEQCIQAIYEHMV